MIHTSARFAFFGTPQLAVDILEYLKRHNLVPSLVVTNPDRPQGRKMVLTSPPVKVWAEANGIPVLQPEKLDQNSELILHNSAPDLFVVVAYGGILPQTVLDIPKFGSLNLHYSLLPKYRGATPIESQILNDDRDVGVSILLLDDKMDHGPTIAQRAIEFPISNFQFPNKSQNPKSLPANPPDGEAGRRAGEIRNNLELRTSNLELGAELTWPPKVSELRAVANKVGAELLTQTIPLWIEGKIQAKEQGHSKATYTRKFTKADGELDLQGDAYKNFLKIQAFEGSIGTYYYANETRVIIRSAEFKNEKLHILRVIPEGKKEMSYEEFVRGLRKPD